MADLITPPFPPATTPKLFITYSHDSLDHRGWVLQLAKRLTAQGVDVILDQFNVRLGSDLPLFISQGLSAAHRVLCICTPPYVERANAGVKISGNEATLIAAHYLADQNSKWVIPLLREGTDEDNLVPLFLKGKTRLDMRDDKLYEANYERLLRDILGEDIVPKPVIGPNPFQNIKAFSQNKFIPANEKYHSPADRGKVSFDHGSNSGHYSFGLDAALFTPHFSAAGAGSVYFYNDDPSIRHVAIAVGAKEFNQIKDASTYNYTSRVRELHNGQFGVLQNDNGFYAAIKVISVRDIDDDTGEGEVVFEYAIQTNGSPDFSNK